MEDGIKVTDKRRISKCLISILKEVQCSDSKDRDPNIKTKGLSR